MKWWLLSLSLLLAFQVRAANPETALDQEFEDDSEYGQQDTAEEEVLDDEEPVQEVLQREEPKKEMQKTVQEIQKPKPLPTPLKVDDNRVVVEREPEPTPSARKYPQIQAGTVNVGGGEKTVKIQHPNVAKGLIKIKKDGSYQYKVQLREKSQSTTVSFASFTSPRITNSSAASPITYSSMYGGSPFGVTASYEWLPFRSFGALGVYLETGFSMSRGRGLLADGEKAEETYSLYIIPITAFLKYRFEFMRRQWFVPYVLGGGTYYGLAEVRDDGSQPTYAGSPAIGGGGGIHFNVSRFDPEGAFRLDREWGIADMWLTVELRVMQGMKPSIDFTNTTLMAGLTLDY